MEKLLKKHGDKIRFIIVGGTNTVLDFALLFLFTGLGLNKFLANTLSTGVAFIFSFFANRSFTFKNKSANVKRQFIWFSIITLSGLWLLQPLIIWLSTGFLESYTDNEQLVLFIAKLIATVFSLVWNYLLYSKVVFKKEEVQ